MRKKGWGTHVYRTPESSNIWLNSSFNGLLHPWLNLPEITVKPKYKKASLLYPDPLLGWGLMAYPTIVLLLSLDFQYLAVIFPL